MAHTQYKTEEKDLISEHVQMPNLLEVDFKLVMLNVLELIRESMPKR
jgi:hypothetical protein